MTGLVVTIGVESVVVPVEECLTAGLQFVEECLLNIIEDVEADEGIDLLSEGRRILGTGSTEALPAQAFDELALEGTFIEDTSAAEVFEEVGVYVAHVVPKAQELLLELAVLLYGEIAEEGTQGFFLFGGDIAVVVKFPELCDVAEELAGINEMLVNILEVGKQDLALGPESVEGLWVFEMTCIGGIEAADALDGVCQGKG